MNIKDITLSEEPQSIYHLDIGTLTVFSTFLVAELKEGISISFDDGQELITIIYDHFGRSGNFGLICNRVQSFSLIPTNTNQIATLFEQNPKVAIINYTTLDQLSAKFEGTYWPFEVALFDDLSEGIAWIDRTVRKAC